MAVKNKAVNFINKNFSDKRIKHILGVAETAVEMAAREGISTDKARTAGLLHDIAKNLSKKKLIKLAANSSWDIDKFERTVPSLLHAPVGADLARQRFNISDFDILEAIRYHTVGSPDMGKLALIIFAADMIEPGRNFPGVEALRAKAEVNLKELVIAVCDHSLKYNINKKRIIHPNTLLLRNKYLGGN